jgi:GxxExxY protein
MNHQDTKTPRGPHEPVPVELDRVATEIVDAALAVHREMGPGLLESVYEACLSEELRRRSLEVERQVMVPLVYRGVPLDERLRLDVLVEKLVLIEVKAVEQLLSVHTAQVLSYLKLMNLRLGFLINFNVPVIRDGIRRIAL